MQRIHRSGIAVALVAATLGPAGAAHAETDDACIAANERAVSLRKSGQLLDARKELSFCAAPTCPDPVKSSCQQRLEQLNRDLPSIVFDVKGARGNDVTDVKLTIDGAAYSGMLAAAITLDPGDHEFKLEAAGQEPVVKHFVLRESEKDRRESIVIGKIAPGDKAMTEKPSSNAAATTTPTATPTATPDESAHDAHSSTWKTVGYVLGGAGIVGLGVGAFFGLQAITNKNSANCDASNYCDAGPLSDARSAATLSTIGFVAGGAVLASGIAVLLLGPSGGDRQTGSLQAAPLVSANAGGLLLRGSW